MLFQPLVSSDPLATQQQQLNYLMNRCSLSLKLIKGSYLPPEVKENLLVNWEHLTGVVKLMNDNLFESGNTALENKMFQINYNSLPHTILLQQIDVRLALRKYQRDQELLGKWCFIWRRFSPLNSNIEE